MGAHRFLMLINHKLDILRNQGDYCVWLVVSNKNSLLKWDRTLNLYLLGEDSFLSYELKNSAVDSSKGFKKLIKNKFSFYC